MKKLLVLLAVLTCVAVSATYAKAIYYAQVLGGGIIYEYEKLNPFNPAGLQFAPNFFQMELYDQQKPASGVTNYNGSGSDVVFSFPMNISYKFNDMAAIRLTLFDSAAAPIYSNAPGFSGTGHASTATAIVPVSLAGITYALKLSDAMGLGLLYCPEMSFQGTYKDDNYQASYFNNRITPGIVMKMDALTLNAFVPINLVFAGAHEASTNKTGVAYTNDLTIKSPLQLISANVQANYKLSETLLAALRVEGGLRNDGYDMKGLGQTNSVEVTGNYLKVMAGLKVSPVPLIDAYIDLGAKWYNHNSMDFEIGTVHSTNTNTVSQMSFPALALGVCVKPGDFRIKLGFTQDLIGTSASVKNTPDSVGYTTWELDTTAFGTQYDGNTGYSLIRTANLGVSYVTKDFCIDTVLDITTGGFLGDEVKNPLNALAHIFNFGSGAMPTLFTGARLSVMF